MLFAGINSHKSGNFSIGWPPYFAVISNGGMSRPREYPYETLIAMIFSSGAVTGALADPVHLRTSTACAGAPATAAGEFKPRPSRRRMPRK